MKFTANRTDLANAAKWVSRAVSKNPQTPILQGMRLDLTASGLRLTATNYDLTLAASVADVTTGELGSVLLPGHALTSLLAALPGRDVTLETSGKGVKVSAGRSQSVFTPLVLDEYPEVRITWPLATNDTIDAEHFAELAGRVTGQSMRDADAGGVVWQAGTQMVAEDGNLTLTAGSRYAISQTAADSDLTITALAPSAGLTLALADMRGPLGIANHDGSLILSTATRRAKIRLYDAELPAAAANLLDAPRPCSVTFDTDELREAVRLANSAGTGRLLLEMRDTPEGAEAVVSAYKPDKGELTHTVGSVIDAHPGDGFTPERFALDAGYFGNALAAMTDDRLTFAYFPAVKPVHISDQHSRHVIMPIRITDQEN